MLRIVKNRVRGGNELTPRLDFFAGVEISIESGKIAAGNLQAKRMPAKEHVARGPEIERDLIHLSWIYQRGMLPGIPVAHAEDPFCNIHGEAIGRDIDQFSRKVRVHSRRLHEESRADWPSDIQILRQRSHRVHQHVLTVLYRALIARSRFHEFLRAAERPSNGWRGISRIIYIGVR